MASQSERCYLVNRTFVAPTVGGRITDPPVSRKNLKISTETYELLREHKDQYETWDGFFHRVFSDD